MYRRGCLAYNPLADCGCLCCYCLLLLILLLLLLHTSHQKPIGRRDCSNSKKKRNATSGPQPVPQVTASTKPSQSHRTTPHLIYNAENNIDGSNAKLFGEKRLAMAAAVAQTLSPHFKTLESTVGKVRNMITKTKKPQHTSGETSEGPFSQWLWKEKSTEAVLELLRDTKIGCINTRRRLPEERSGDEEAGTGDEGEEGGPASPGV